MDPYEAAQSIFPNIARPLQKFLRITRQQPRHTMESILQHLANCLKFDMSPKAFLERYVVTSPVLQVRRYIHPVLLVLQLHWHYLFQNDREHKPVQPWALICDTLLSRNLKPGIIFQLRQGTEVSLLCEVHPLPHFSISEEVIDHRTNRFLLRHHSETPVWYERPKNPFLVHNIIIYKKLPPKTPNHPPPFKESQTQVQQHNSEIDSEHIHKCTRAVKVESIFA